jgi:diguanylate cyclase (GGDEF)-like protein
LHLWASAESSEAAFPVRVQLPDGSSVLIASPEPGLLSQFDPEILGSAVINELGIVQARWGLAKNNSNINVKRNALETDLAPLILAAFRGVSGAVHLDGVRYFAAPIVTEGKTQVLLLVTNAQDELALEIEATKYRFEAVALRKLGKVFTMNQTIEPLCYAAVHEIASVAELAAVLMWVRRDPDGPYELVASVGTNRHGVAAVNQLHDRGNYTCVPELVLAKRQSVMFPRVQDHMMTAELEAKFCYLKPGSLLVMPIIVSDHLLGVIEIIGRDGDLRILEHKDLFETIVEHLSLAVNSALMFESFERLASIDPLTGIANHRSLQEFLARRVHESHRANTELGVIMIDVDHFRLFNEEEGHDAGDTVLRKVAEAIKSMLRPYDLAARYGGEEFTVVLPGAGEVETMTIAERIRQKIAQIEFVATSGRTRHVTASLGCATMPKIAQEAVPLLKAADEALYQAKRSGRNRCVMHNGNSTGLGQDAPATFNIEPLLDRTTRSQSKRMFAALRPYIDHLAVQLALSATQRNLLEALVRIVPAYLRAVRKGDEAKLQQIETDPELRLLWPSLIAVNERFDGGGPLNMKQSEIPLLARVLSVLLSIYDGNGILLIKDRGRFDPDLVSKITHGNIAA